MCNSAQLGCVSLMLGMSIGKHVHVHVHVHVHEPFCLFCKGSLVQARSMSGIGQGLRVVRNLS